MHLSINTMSAQKRRKIDTVESQKPGRHAGPGSTVRGSDCKQAQLIF
jgi:hypothetical protein